jgi:hypothetical protein
VALHDPGAAGFPVVHGLCAHKPRLLFCLVAAAGDSDNTWACSVGASQCNGAEAKQWVNNQEYCCFGTDSIDVEVMNNKVQCTCGDGESAEEPHSNTTAVSAPTVPNLVDICYRYTNDVVGSNVHVIGSGGAECYAMWLNYTLAIHSGAGHDMTDMVRVIFMFRVRRPQMKWLRVNHP